MTTALALPFAIPPGFGRAFGRTTVFGFQRGVTVPLPGVTVRAYVPGTITPWPDPLYADESDAIPVVFPVATDATGAVALWGEEPGRLELECVATGYGTQRVVLDLEVPPPSDTDDPYPQYLTPAEGDAAYLPVGTPIPPSTHLASSDGTVVIAEAPAGTFDLKAAPGGASYTKAESDTKFVDAAGDTMTGALTVQGTTVLNGSFLATSGYNALGGAALPGLNVFFDAAAGATRAVQFRSGIATRWLLQTNAVAETGANAGSDFQIDRYDDAGGLLGTALSLSRATGAAAVGGLLSCRGPAGGLVFEGRDGGAGYMWYGTGGDAHLFNMANGAQPIHFTAPGDTTVSGALTVGSKPVTVSPTAGNALTWDATGLYVASLEARVAALESKMTTHLHANGTVGQIAGAPTFP